MYIFVPLGLALITLVVYWRSLSGEFIQFYDDVLYVTDNPHVQAGLTIESIVWAFTTGFGANWHPLTWISHMLDWQLFGLNPWGHHLTSLLFHVANTILLFFVLLRMTNGLWQSAFVAALFALHPLHVESVAWIAERKDVLSTFFWILTMWAYLRYVERQETKNYALLALALTLGLMAKPMLVTLPFVLLLLDYWPLNRTQFSDFRTRLGQRLDQGSHVKLRKLPLQDLVKEKAPLFALVAVSSLVTFVAQQQGGAMQTVENLPVLTRVANAVVVYVSYVEKMIWPSGLSAYYPHPGASRTLLQVALPGLVLFIISASVVLAKRRRPYLVVGWCWYLGALIPTIGLVQVGSQAMADRYTYVPLIGLFMMIAWGIPELVLGWKKRTVILTTTGILVIGAMLTVTWWQVGYWKNASVLFSHAVSVTSGNWLAHSNLGSALALEGKTEEAIEQQQEALRIRPNYPEAEYNIGVALASLGRTEEAISHYKRAIQSNPNYTGAHNNLGLLLAGQGKTADAIAHYREALRIEPEYAEGHTNLGSALESMGNIDEAIVHYRQAIRSKPNLWNAHFNFALALAKQGKIAEAISHYNETLRLKPDYADAHNNLGKLLEGQGKISEAMTHYAEALRMNPEHADAHKNIALILAGEGKNAEAMAHFSEVLRIRPNDAESQRNLSNLIAGGEKSSNVKVYYNLGIYLDGQGRIAEAIVQYNEALKLKPDYAEVRNNLGVALGKQGRLDDAIAQLSEALRTKPDFVDAHNNLAIAFAMQGRTAEAIEHLNDLLILNPRQTSARYNLGLLLAKQGRVADAMNQFSEALKINPNYVEARNELEKLQQLKR